MMRVTRSLHLALVVLMTLVASASHAGETKVEVDMMCPIVAVEPGAKRLTIGRGSDQGLVVGARGDVYAASQGSSGIDGIVARAELVEVKATESVAVLVEGSVVDAARVTPGAFLEVRALLPANVHRGILFELYVKGIELLDNSPAPIVSAKELLSATSDAVEKRALADMVRCGREVVEFTLELTQVQTRTRWKGKALPYILEHNDERDYLEFLRFVMDYPGKYIGKQWKISETYATWVINFSPPGYADLWTDIANSRGAARAAIVNAMKESDLLALLERVRQEAADATHAQQAALLQELAIVDDLLKLRFGKAKPPAELRAEQAQIRARIYHEDKKRWPDAMKAYREAAAAYLEVGSELGRIHHVICLNNVASLLERSERADEALAQVDTIRAFIAAEVGKFKDPSMRSHFELAELFPAAVAARILKSRGQYREAIALLGALVDRAAATGARGARGREMEALELIGDAHVKLGEVDQAAALYARVTKLAQELGDDSRRASTEWSVGDMYYARSRYAESAAAFARSADIARAAKLDAAEAKALAATGQALWKMGKTDEAVAKHEQAMKLREQNGDKSAIAWQATQVAEIQVERGDREAAKRAYAKAIDIYAELEEQSNEADVRLDLADLHVQLKQAAEAERHLGAARAIYKKLKRVPMEATVLRSLAATRSMLDDYRGAEKLLRQAIALLEKTGDVLELVSTKIWLAGIIRDLGDAKAARVLLLSLVPKDPAKEPGTDIDVLVQLGWLDNHEGQPEAAKLKAEQALKKAEANQDVWRTLKALELQRSVLSTLGDHEARLVACARSRDIARATANRPAEVDALAQEAWTLTDVGRLSEAKTVGHQALDIVKTIDDPSAHAWTLNTVSRVYAAYNDTRTELAMLDESYALMQSVNNRYGLAAIVFNRALIYARLRDIPRALAGYDEAETIVGTRMDSEFEIALQSARAQGLVFLKRFAEAETKVKIAIATARTASPSRLINLLVINARLLSELGRHDEAIVQATEAATLSEKFSAEAYGGRAALGRAYARAGRDAEATTALEQVIAKARKHGGELPWEALFELAVLRSKAGDRKGAVGLLQEAVKAIEGQEVILAQDSAARADEEKVQVFRLLVKLLLADQRVDEAFQYLERSKVAELRQLDMKSGAGSDQNTALAIELDVQEGKLQELLDAELSMATPNADKVKKLDDLIAQASKRRAEFMEKIDRKDALFDRYAVRPLQLEQLQQYLGEGVLIIAPVMLEESLVVFAMTKDALTHYTTPMPPGALDKLVADFVREAHPKNAAGVKGKASLAKVKAQGQRLYDLLLRPAIDAVGMPKTLVLSPTGALRYLPFAALYDGKAFVVERTAVVSVTALDREKFAVAAPKGGTETSIMALVDPDGTLPAARVELAEVKKVFQNLDVFEGAQASAETLRHKVRVPGYDVVHFATHGQLDAKNPELSHIILAGSSLSYGDIATLAPTKTRLVVLSACQTAVLSGGSGLEIAGLAYQFQRGRLGVHSVMATLWQVDDRATADLMVRFYQEIRAGKSYADALAATQRALLATEGYEHPGYWAPFVLMGTP